MLSLKHMFARLICISTQQTVSLASGCVSIGHSSSQNIFPTSSIPLLLKFFHKFSSCVLRRSSEIIPYCSPIHPSHMSFICPPLLCHMYFSNRISMIYHSGLSKVASDSTVQVQYRDSLCTKKWCMGMMFMVRLFILKRF